MGKSRRIQSTERAASFGLPDDGAWRRSYMRLPATVGEVAGFPIKAYGRIFIYGVSPDFDSGVVLQAGTQTPQVKLRPKKSWEMQGNKIGSMVSWQPRTPQNDYQPLLAANLIDGDPSTFWCSRGQMQPDVEPVWIRIDLAKEESLREITLVPSRDGQGIPQELEIRVSRDGWHWESIYDGTTGARANGNEPMRFPPANPAPAKQIWIIGRHFPAASAMGEHCFKLAGVEAINERGENVALLTRGAGITVSSTDYGEGSSWDVYDLLWPTQYDLGATWMRLSGSNPPWHNDTLQWRFVEREKGKYVIDRKTDLAITEAANNGCKIIVILCYGNWLYTSEPEKESFDKHDFPPPFPPGPVTRKGIEGYKKWVRFMARHFRGRVAAWEVYNEAISFGYEVVEDFRERVRVYCELLREVAPIIREEDPNALVCLAGMAGMTGPDFCEEGQDWLRACLAQGVAPLVDVISWHDGGAVIPAFPGWDAYPQAVRNFKQLAEAYGFRGSIYMDSELAYHAPYPRPTTYWLPEYRWNLTEIRKAKDTARAFAMQLGLGVMPFWCNTWDDYRQIDCGIFRNTFSGDPVSPTQPEPAYYVLRTLCTVLDGAEPMELEVRLANQEQRLENYSFSLAKGGLLVGLWLPGQSVDSHPGVTTDVSIGANKCKKVIGIDILNGFEQELQFEQRGNMVVVPGVVVRDYPLMLRLESR